MVQKHKKHPIKDNLTGFAQNIGLLAMGTAMAVGFVEFAGAHGSRAIVPVAANASPNAEHSQTAGGGEHMRGVKEETGPHFVSYGSMHRTPGRSAGM